MIGPLHPLDFASDVLNDTNATHDELRVAALAAYDWAVGHYDRMEAMGLAAQTKQRGDAVTEALWRAVQHMAEASRQGMESMRTLAA